MITVDIFGWIAGALVLAASCLRTKRQLSLVDSAIEEGNSGITNMAFTVNLDTASCFDTEADFSSNIVTADVLDFILAGGSLIFLTEID